MLIIARHRWSANDQKNHEAIIELLREFLSAEKAKAGVVQFIIGPLGKRSLGLSRHYYGQLQKIMKEHRKNLFVESHTGLRQCIWDDLLCAADAQILPSRREPCGINHAQGMGYGVVPICSAKGAVIEKPVSDSNSFRFDWDESSKKQRSKSFRRFVAAVGTACRTFFSDRERWERMQKDAIKAAKYYDWQSLAPKYGKLFR
jgi:glycogen synthase